VTWAFTLIAKREESGTLIVVMKADMARSSSRDEAEMTTRIVPSDADLRSRLVNEMAGDGTIVSPAVESAFRAVPRHLFAPGVPLEQVYARAIVVVKQDQHGVPVSTMSAPEIQARMLEQAAIEPGMRVLEIGSGGFNAAFIWQVACRIRACRFVARGPRLKSGW